MTLCNLLTYFIQRSGKLAVGIFQKRFFFNRQKSLRSVFLDAAAFALKVSEGIEQSRIDIIFINLQLAHNGGCPLLQLKRFSLQNIVIITFISLIAGFVLKLLDVLISVSLLNLAIVCNTSPLRTEEAIFSLISTDKSGI